MTDGTAANQIAALSLLLADDQLMAITRTTGLSPGAAAALVVVGHAPGESIDFLRRVLGRSHSTVVRLVASLTEGGLLQRASAEDKRTLALNLSERGAALCREALDAREQAVAARLSVLTARERESLQKITAKLLTAAATDEITAFRVCRLCDAEACETCPVEAAFEDA